MFYKITQLMQCNIMSLKGNQMNATPDPGLPSSTALADRLDSVRMHSFDRALAKKHLIRAERTVDLAFAAARAIRKAVNGWKELFFPPADQQRDAYLSGAVDRVDLEQRIRNWERRPTPFWDGV